MVLRKSSAPSQREKTPSPRRREVNQGRVRTGCLTCRNRKVKCDEQRPTCQKCFRSKRACVYRRGPPAVPLNPTNTVSHPQVIATSADIAIPPQTHIEDPPVQEQHHSPDHIPDRIPDRIPIETIVSDHPTQSPEVFSTSAGVNDSPHNHHDSQPVELNNAESPSDRFQSTSMQIYVTTTLDWLGPGQQPQSYSYFIEEVDCPFISSFDHLNWERIKLHIARLALQNPSVAAAIVAVQQVHRSQVDRLPTFHAFSEYQAGITNLELMSENDTLDFDTVLVIALLLCLCEVFLPNEDGPAFRGFNQTFESKIEVWLLGFDRSPISLRICIWLQFLHVVTKRVGSYGLLTESIFNLLNNRISEIPGLSLVGQDNSANAMYDIISAPVFAFYLELQRITNQVHDLSHYRRSRITPADQEEVADIVIGLRKKMSILWNSRPAPLRFQPSQLREHFCREIAEPLIAFTGVCIASYFGELVELRRTLGDDPFPSPESEEARRQIRDTVDGDWNVTIEGALNPGYVRPLFLFAIETLQEDETNWAVTRLKQVKSPTIRSGFVASLGESLGQAQRKEQRRVATKYFCNGAFNIPVPRM